LPLNILNAPRTSSLENPSPINCWTVDSGNPPIAVEVEVEVEGVLVEGVVLGFVEVVLVVEDGTEGRRDEEDEGVGGTSSKSSFFGISDSGRNGTASLPILSTFSLRSIMH